MRSLFIGLLGFLFVPLLHAAPVAPPVRAEIDAVLSALQSSGCKFNRNGSWYAAAKAKTHLLRKLEYLERNNAVQTTEQFIELAAARSSSSGKPYLVKCGSTSPVESKQWLTVQLNAVRSSGRETASGAK
ncbi:MAG: DUF5329 domain-containing protein [Pseudomonadota bacterium]